MVTYGKSRAFDLNLRGSLLRVVQGGRGQVVNIVSGEHKASAHSTGSLLRISGGGHFAFVPQRAEGLQFDRTRNRPQTGSVRPRFEHPLPPRPPELCVQACASLCKLAHLKRLQVQAKPLACHFLRLAVEAAAASNGSRRFRLVGCPSPKLQHHEAMSGEKPPKCPTLPLEINKPTYAHSHERPHQGKDQRA